LPTGLVVKNGSKIRARISDGTPGPVSSTSIRTRPAARRERTVNCPPESPIAWNALVIRFRSTCWIWPGSPAVYGRPGARSRAMRIFWVTPASVTSVSTRSTS